MSATPITKANFNKEVLESSRTVLLDFWAPWCGPCRMVGPVLDEIANENSDILVGKINVDQERELAARFGVMSIPMMVVIRDGKIVKQDVGARPKAQILEMIRN